MKKFIIVAACLQIGLLAAGLTSCTDRTDVQQSKSDPHQWEQYLQYALSRGVENGSNKVSLVGYNYRGKIKTENEKQNLINEMFADDAYILVHNSAELKDPELKTWGNLRSESAGYGQKLQDGIGDDIIIGETDVIDLDWSFNNMTYHSVAIANDKNGKIIYDNIGTYAIEHKSYERKESFKMETKVPSSSSDAYHCESFHRRETGTNEYGFVQWVIEIECYTYFNEFGIMTDFTVGQHHRAEQGWSCDAGVRSVRGGVNVSNFHEFAWGYAYGNDKDPARVEFDGGQYYISYGSLGGETGVSTHKAPKP